QSGLFGFKERNNFAFEVAARDRIVGLQGVETGEILELGDAQRFGNPPGLPVGAADVADFALSDEAIEGAKSLFQRGNGVVAVDLVEVDIVGLEAAKAGFDGVHDVSARGAYIVAAGTDATEDLGRENNILAGDVEILEGLAEALFAFTFGIDVGRVEEVDAGIDARLDELLGTPGRHCQWPSRSPGRRERSWCQSRELKREVRYRREYCISWVLALHLIARQAAIDGPCLENLEVFDPPDAVFLDHREEGRRDLAFDAQEIDLDHCAMVVERG